MAERPRENPIYARLTQHTRLPSVRVMLWAGFGLGLVTLGVTLYDTLQLRQQAIRPVTGWLMLASGLVMLIGPLAVAAASGVLVGRDSGSDDYAMILMTPLTARDIVRGYMAASLARMRVLLALAVGLTPALVVGLIQVNIMVAVVFFNLMASRPISLGPGAGPPQTSVTANIVSNSFMIALMLATWSGGLFVMGASLGVLFGLRLRRPGPGAASAAGTLAGLIALSIALLPMSLYLTPMLGYRAPLYVGLIDMAAPYAIAAWALKAARNHARRANQP